MGDRSGSRSILATYVCYVGLVSVKSTLDIPNRCTRLSRDFWIVDLGLND
jgi:hypothetical protein